MAACTCDFRSETIKASPYGEPTRDLHCPVHGDAVQKEREEAYLNTPLSDDELRSCTFIGHTHLVRLVREVQRSREAAAVVDDLLSMLEGWDQMRSGYGLGGPDNPDLPCAREILAECRAALRGQLP